MVKEGKGLKQNLIWDKALFKEGVRQTKWMAVTTIIVSILFIDYEPLASLVGLIMACIMLYRLLKFSNKRNSSDFYSALCRNRITVYASYLSVVLMWIIVLTIIFYIVSRLNVSFITSYTKSYESYGVTDSNYNSLYYSALRDTVEYLAFMLLGTGAFAVSMASTGNAITHVMAMIIILFAPRFFSSYCLSGYYDLVPFISENEGISKLVNNNLNVIYDNINDMFFITKSCVSLSDSFWIPVLYSCFLGIILMVLGAVIFRKKKAEDAGVVALSGFWKFVIRTTIALIIAIAADLSCSNYIFNGVNAESDLKVIIIMYVVSILVWLLIDLFTGRSKKKLFKSMIQLPAFAAVNILIVVSIVMCGYAASDVPEIEEIKSVKVEDIKIDYNDAKSLDAYQKMEKLYRMVDESYLENEKVKDLIYKRLSNDMIRFKSPSINYSMDIEFDDYIQVSIETDSKKIVRYISSDGYFLQDIMNCYVEASADIYDYKLPIKHIGPMDYDRYKLGCLYSFAWDFSSTELLELYNCFYEEAANNTFSLKTFLDVEYNTEGVFEYLTFHDSTMDSQVYIPIGVNSPKSLEKLAEISNTKRTDFDFEWFVDYVQSIGDEERGAALDVLLYTGNEPNIRYEAFSFWSNYTADLSDENLNKLLAITRAHEHESEVSADENILVILYRGINDVNTTCKWFNISDEEAAIVDNMIWADGYFDILSYSNFDVSNYVY